MAPAITAARGGLHVLHPGDVALALRGERFDTLLGSCVAIILTDPRRTVGVMCHIVHSGGSPPAAAQGGNAHAEPAFDTMFALLQARGINPLMCEAYLFGGGNMFPSLFTRAHVGQGNAQWALDTLARRSIALVAHDVGGTTYRRIAWTVGPGAPRVDAVAV